MLQENDHRLVRVRDGATDRGRTSTTLREIRLRDTDWTDDRLARIRTMLGAPTVTNELT